jgi:hypothetical protein
MQINPERNLFSTLVVTTIGVAGVGAKHVVMHRIKLTMQDAWSDVTA